MRAPLRALSRTVLRGGRRGFLTAAEMPEEHAMLRDMCRSFANDNLVPRAAEWDREHSFPADAVRACAELGLMGVAISPEYGGSGLDYKAYALAIEVCMPRSIHPSIHSFILSLTQRNSFSTPIF